MAKRKEQEMVTENEEVTAEESPAAVEESKTDERFKMIKHPDTGEMVKRRDFILDCWQNKRMTRGNIARQLSEITGKKVPYQIVFSTTKGKPGGPDKTAAAAESSEKPAE